MFWWVVRLGGNTPIGSPCSAPPTPSPSPRQSHSHFLGGSERLALTHPAGAVEKRTRNLSIFVEKCHSVNGIMPYVLYEYSVSMDPVHRYMQ